MTMPSGGSVCGAGRAERMWKDRETSEGNPEEADS